MAVDFTLTVWGQHPQYWAGYQRVEESNPVWAALLHIHPAAFLAGVILYAIVFSAGIYRCPRPIAWWLSVLLLLTHASGARSWLWKFSADYFTLLEITLNGAIAVLATGCYLMASRRTTTTSRERDAGDGDERQAGGFGDGAGDGGVFEGDGAAGT